MNKKRIFLVGANVKKNGHNDGRQTYQCKDCGKRFRGCFRIQSEALWNEYVGGHRTLAELASLHSCSEVTVRRRLTSGGVTDRKLVNASR